MAAVCCVTSGENGHLSPLHLAKFVKKYVGVRRGTSTLGFITSLRCWKGNNYQLDVPTKTFYGAIALIWLHTLAGVIRIVGQWIHGPFWHRSLPEVIWIVGQWKGSSNCRKWYCVWSWLGIMLTSVKSDYQIFAVVSTVLYLALPNYNGALGPISLFSRNLPYQCC